MVDATAMAAVIIDTDHKESSSSKSAALLLSAKYVDRAFSKFFLVDLN
jgi:hypothetical protein